jgi:pyridinium-3,5-biscarboxylic acid mononucleotide sulfurtransferase
MLQDRLHLLNQILDSFPRVLVAYSGGADSVCLLYAAQQKLGERALGIIADSPSLPRSELENALRIANQMKLSVEVVQTDEFSNPDYLANPVNRCYFCKHALFTKMEKLAEERAFPVLAYGENADDVSDFRPGAEAAKRFQVRAPLKEAGLTKLDVRSLSREWNLPTSEKPASPCLSSRIPHGTPVSLDALAKVEKGEEEIRSLGFRIFRLRYNQTKAELEFDPAELSRAKELQGSILEAIRKLGFQEIEIRTYKGAIR